MRPTVFTALLLFFFSLTPVRADDRVLRFFDFDERAAGNVEDLPMHWSKVTGTGLPTYLQGRMVRGVGRSSPYSFRFDLNGGSLMYRYEGRDLPAHVGGRYRVEGFVKTTVLENARARITLQLLDQDFSPLPGSRVDSDVYASAAGTAADWQPLMAEIRAEDPRVAYVQIDLGLLQPNLYAARTLGDRTIFNQDVQGSAWFTDVLVSQIPELMLTPTRPGGIFAGGEEPGLRMSVNDRILGDLNASVEIRDAAGNLLHQQNGPITPNGPPSADPMSAAVNKGLWQQTIMAPAMPPGWYIATLKVTSGGKVVGERSTTLVQLADGRKTLNPDVRLGLSAIDVPPGLWGQLPDLVAGVNGGRLKLALWSPNNDVQTADADTFQNLLTRLDDIGIRPTACITGVPPMMAELVGGNDLDHLLKADPTIWQNSLKLLVARHATHLDRWQLGADGSDVFARNPKWQAFYQQVRGSISELVPQSDLAFPWPALYETDQSIPGEVALSIPTSVLPEQIPLYVNDLKERSSRTFSLGLVPLDRHRYGRDVYTRDYVQRIVWAFASEATRVDVPLPCRISDDGRRLEPDELYPVLRTLAFWLADAKYAGKVPVAEGVDGFLFDRNGTGIIMAWTSAMQAEGRGVTTRLNVPGDAKIINCFGMPVASVPAGPGMVDVQLSSLPILITPVDAGLARLRASAGFDKPLLESSFQSHTRKFRMVNTMNEPISGTVKLVGEEGWNFLPGAIGFALNPGETLEKEVGIEFPYSTAGGPHKVEAVISLSSQTMQKIRVPMQLRLGLSDIGMQSLVLRDGDDVIVQQLITNYGTKAANYTAFAVLAGQARQEKLVTSLGASRTVLKRFRFAGAAKGASPKTPLKVRTGLREIDGQRMLNDDLVLQ